MYSSLVPPIIHENWANQQRAGTLRAAALFVDISGFTTLTESLMAHHKDGAELLSDVVMAIFDPMVAQVAACGGIIPLFAGDAFAAIFPQDDGEPVDLAVRRALHVLDFIRRYFSEPQGTRDFATPYGVFAIGVKVGLSFGEVEWGIPGENGRYTYYFRGPAITQAVEAQSLAQPGEAIADETIRAYIQPLAGVWPTLDARYFYVGGLRAGGLQGLGNTAVPPPISAADVAPFIPEAQQAWSGEAEFRRASPVFIAFEAPATQDQLHAFVTAVMLLSERYGGAFSQVDFSIPGGYLVIWFGLPASHENNADRALSFLLALKRQLVLDEALTAVPWRAGVADGLVWAGLRGGQARCEYGAIGDVVNVAARLAMRAPTHEIWTTRSVYTALKSAYSFLDLGELPLKGKSKHLPVYQVVRKRRNESGLLHYGRLYGRSRELDRLHAFAQPIFAGQFAGVFYLDGEAGIGKSHLLTEFSREISRERPALIAYCPSDEVLQTSLNPFRTFLGHYFLQEPAQSQAQNKEKFEQVLTALRRSLPAATAVAAQIEKELDRSVSFLAALVNLDWPDDLYAQLEPKLRFENTRAAIKNLIKAESLVQPVILVVQDAHWLDADSQEMLQYLVREIADFPVVVLIEGRYDAHGRSIRLNLPDHVPQAALALDYLSVTDVGLLAGRVVGAELSPQAVAFIHQKTNGNPLFVEHLALSLWEQGALLPAEDGRVFIMEPTAVKSTPQTLEAVLVSRLDSLSPDVRQLVQTAAVLGMSFDMPVLAALTNTLHLAAQIQHAERAQVWTAVSQNRYAFAHALLRDAAYHMQLPSRLRALHRQAAVALETVFQANLAPWYADLVYHWHLAGDSTKECYFAVLAGRFAEAHYANREAVDLFTRAMNLLPPEQEALHYELNLTLEQLYHLLGERERQFQELNDVAESLSRPGNIRQRAELALRLARYAEVTGDFWAMKGAGQLAASLALQANDPWLEAVSYQQLGNIHQRLENYEKAVTITGRALRLAQQVGAQDIEAKCLRTLGAIAWKHSQFAEASAFLRKALALDRQTSDRIGEGETLNKLGLVAENSHQYELAESYYRQALEMFQLTGDRWSQSIALGNLGYLYGRVGLYEQAQTYYTQDLSICREIDDRRGQSWTSGNLSLLFSWQGDFEQAWRLGLQTLTLAESLKNESLQAYALSYLGRAYAGQGKWAKATAVYQQSLTLRRKLRDQLLVLETLANLAYISLRQSNLAQAQAHLTGVMCYLRHAPLDRMEEPLRVYWICYLVLQASGQPEAAWVLQQAYERIQTLAQGIISSEWRASFLDNVRIHREIRRLWPQDDRALTLRP